MSSETPSQGIPIPYVPDEDDPDRQLIIQQNKQASVAMQDSKPTVDSEMPKPDSAKKKNADVTDWSAKIAAARAAHAVAPGEDAPPEKRSDQDIAKPEVEQKPIVQPPEVESRPEGPVAQEDDPASVLVPLGKNKMYLTDIETEEPVVKEDSASPATNVIPDGPLDEIPEEEDQGPDLTDELGDILEDTEVDDVSLESQDVTPPEKEPEPQYDKNEDEDPIMDVPIGNIVDDMTHLSAKYNPFMDKEVIRKRLRDDPDDFYVSVMQMFATVGSSVELARDYLERLLANGIKLQKNPEGVPDEIIKNKPLAEGQQRRKLTGPEAKMAVLARAKGLRKVHLLNSGFWVLLRPMQLTELSQWYNSASMDAKDFGKLLGGHAFMFSDVLLRKTFMDILPTIVVDSNLEGWRNPQRMAKLISIHDLDTLIWAECTLIYKQGVTVNLQSTNEDCQFVANNVNVDLEKLRFNNLSAMTEEATKYLANQLVTNANVTADQLKRYHKALGFNRDIEVGDVTYKCHVPSVNYFCECGAEFVKMVLNSVKGLDNSVDNIDQGIESNVRLNIAKTYLPWVYKIVTPDFETEDKDAILTQMEQDVRAGHILQDEILKYQYDTKISYFCYTMLECPKCHKTPSKSLNDYYPLDPTYLFFFLCSRQLSLMMS